MEHAREPAYRNLKMPGRLMARVDRFVEDNDDGFRSAAEVVATAVREYLDRKDAKRAEQPPRLAPAPKDERAPGGRGSQKKA